MNQISTKKAPGKMLAMALLPLQFMINASCYTSQRAATRKLAEVKSLQPLDAIIVPGIPYNGICWDSVMKSRVVWSVWLFKQGVAKNIIFSGSAVYTPWQEAFVMSKYALELGVPEEHIFLDTLAEHSSENVYYSYLLAKRRGFKSIGLATDPFQSRMLSRFTKKHFETFIYHLPFVFNELKPLMVQTVNHSVSSVHEVSNFVALPDRESFWVRFRGTLGKNIDWSRFKNKKVGQL